MNKMCTVHTPQAGAQFNNCPDCGFTTWARNARLSEIESRCFSDRIEHRQPKKHHDYLHRSGTTLTSLYVINSGFLKTSISDGNGHEQITGFSMPSDLLGMDAIATGRHQCNTVALEDSTLCGIAFTDLEELNRQIPALQHQFHRILGAEITRDHDMMLLLGAMHAEERVAVFLLNLSRRFALRGCSANDFHLPMTRKEIGNYLGLTLETVSRAFSHLAQRQLIVIDGRTVAIGNVGNLQAMVRDCE